VHIKAKSTDDSKSEIFQHFSSYCFFSLLLLCVSRFYGATIASKNRRCRPSSSAKMTFRATKQEQIASGEECKAETCEVVCLLDSSLSSITNVKHICMCLPELG
jgi:hypothetical protein